MGGGRLTLTGSAEGLARGVGAAPPPRGRVSFWRGGFPGLETGGPFPDSESALENLAVPETAPLPRASPASSCPAPAHLLAARREGVEVLWGGAPGHHGRHGGQQKADPTILEARGQGSLLPAPLQPLVLLAGPHRQASHGLSPGGLPPVYPHPHLPALGGTCRHRARDAPPDAGHVCSRPVSRAGHAPSSGQDWVLDRQPGRVVMTGRTGC